MLRRVEDGVGEERLLLDQVLVAARADDPCDFRRLFLAHYARIRATCLAFAEPGVALFAFSTGDGTWQGSMCLAARPGELRAGVVGRHSAADLFLDAPTLALRHLVLLLEPLPLRAALRGEVRFRVMDPTRSPARVTVWPLVPAARTDRIGHLGPAARLPVFRGPRSAGRRTCGRTRG